MWSPDASLAVVDLVLYLVLFPFSIYTVFTHRRHSLIGHGFLWTFILLRFIADGIIIHQGDDANPSGAGAIVSESSIGALLLAISGFRYEVSYYISLNETGDGKPKMKFLLEIIHVYVVLLAILLLTIGYARSNIDNVFGDAIDYDGLACGGAIILLLFWVYLVIQTIFTAVALAKPDNGEKNMLSRLGLAVLFTSIMSGLRVLEIAVETFSNSVPSLAMNVVLAFMPQVYCATVLVAGAVVTRDIRTDITGVRRLPKEFYDWQVAA